MDLAEASRIIIAFCKPTFQSLVAAEICENSGASVKGKLNVKILLECQLEYSDLKTSSLPTSSIFL